MGNAMSAMSREDREAESERERWANGGKAIVNRDDLLLLLLAVNGLLKRDRAETKPFVAAFDRISGFHFPDKF
jgi:hypothetical protein